VLAPRPTPKLKDLTLHITVYILQVNYLTLTIRFTVLNPTPQPSTVRPATLVYQINDSKAHTNLIVINFCRILTMVCWYWTNCTFGLYPSSGVSKNWGI